MSPKIRLMTKKLAVKLAKNKLKSTEIWSKKAWIMLQSILWALKGQKRVELIKRAIKINPTAILWKKSNHNLPRKAHRSPQLVSSLIRTRMIRSYRIKPQILTKMPLIWRIKGLLRIRGPQIPQANFIWRPTRNNHLTLWVQSHQIPSTNHNCPIITQVSLTWVQSRLKTAFWRCPKSSLLSNWTSVVSLRTRRRPQSMKKVVTMSSQRPQRSFLEDRLRWVAPSNLLDPVGHAPFSLRSILNS